MALGRPITYTERHLELTKEYLEICQDTESMEIIEGVTEDIGMPDGSTINKSSKTRRASKKRVRLPSIEGLVRYMYKNGMTVYRSTIYEWKESIPTFSDMLEQILAEQCERLVNESMANEYNSNIAKLLLAKHGYRDSQEIDQKTTVNIVGEVLNDIGITRPNLTNER